MIKRGKPLTFILVAAVSLDGKITAGKKEGSDWTSVEDKKFFQAEMDRADAIVMGRRTFDAIKRPLKPRNRIIFTHEAVIPAKAGIQIAFSGNQKELIMLLENRGWSRIAVVGGTQVYDWFLTRNLVDEIYLTLEPVVFGTGKPLASKGRTPFSKFRLVSVKRLNSQGTLLLHSRYA